MNPRWLQLLTFPIFLVELVVLNHILSFGIHDGKLLLVAGLATLVYSLDTDVTPVKVLWISGMSLVLLMATSEVGQRVIIQIIAGYMICTSMSMVMACTFVMMNLMASDPGQ